MAHRITLIPGDGIGPEVASAVVRIIESSGVEIEWEEHVAGQAALDKSGTTLPDASNIWVIPIFFPISIIFDSTPGSWYAL